jgi:hypothetical protein
VDSCDRARGGRSRPVPAAIVQARDGGWAAFEVRLGGEKLIEEGVANLLRFAGQVDASRSGPVAHLGVIVATGFGYQREDGVAAIPIGALAP